MSSLAVVLFGRGVNLLKTDASRESVRNIVSFFALLSKKQSSDRDKVQRGSARLCIPNCVQQTHLRMTSRDCAIENGIHPRSRNNFYCTVSYRFRV